MRKLTKRGLIKKLDKLVSDIVRSRGVCARCRRGGESVVLQCSHIFSRRNFSVRFDLNNCLCLCLRCHLYWAHKNPIEFYEFVQEHLGKYNFAQLKQKAQQIHKYTLSELQELYETLKKETP